VQVRHHAGPAVGLTFDNLGEVADLHRGRWPADAPLGRHASVTRTLPRVLLLLAEAGVRATFFVEGLNAELYPEALTEIAAAGHEVGFHGWQHEQWSSLDADSERASLEQGVTALDALGLRPVGFRPPGGALTPSSLALLHEYGFDYCSPEGTEVEVDDGLVVLPFRWEHVDAFYYLPSFAGLRGGDEPLPPARLRDAIAGDDYVTLIFHPFLLEDAERFEVLRWAVEQVSGRSAPCRELAQASR
jgi:peptidoglycan/xylan/chitin deacetylase (PgdA/CDA1 family)